MKISYRADFPKISRTLVIDAVFDDAVVWVMDSDKVQLLALEKFNDLDSAIDYYTEQFVLFADKEGFECSHVVPSNLTPRSGLPAQQVPEGVYQGQKAPRTCGVVAEANLRVPRKVLLVAP